MAPLQILESFPLWEPDLLILGMNSGGEAGWEVGAAVHSSVRIPACTCVLVSFLPRAVPAPLLTAFTISCLEFKRSVYLSAALFKLPTGLCSPRSLWEQARCYMAF